MMHHFIKESRIAAPPERVFAFHESPDALQRLIPPWERVRVVQPPESLRPGIRVVLKVSLGPIPLLWVSEHTEYEPGRLFADRQLRGPFAYWYHRHRFLDDGRGGTVLRDEVDYRPPFGWVGEWFGSRYLKSKLDRMFEYRHETTRRAVERQDGGRNDPRDTVSP